MEVDELYSLEHNTGITETNIACQRFCVNLYIYISTMYDQARSQKEPSAPTPTLCSSFLASDRACI